MKTYKLQKNMIYGKMKIVYYSKKKTNQKNA